MNLNQLRNTIRTTSTTTKPISNMMIMTSRSLCGWTPWAGTMQRSEMIKLSGRSSHLLTSRWDDADYFDNGHDNDNDNDQIKWVKDLEINSNQSGAVGGIIWGPFQGSLTHLGASKGLRSQKRGPYLAIFGPSLTPPANPVKFFWSKMACTGVPHIVLHVSCRTRTSGGYFWPSEVRFRGILAHFDRLIL